MNEINALFARGHTGEQILEIAHTEPKVRAELLRLLEQKLNRPAPQGTLASQARFAMRLNNSQTRSGLRHSEL